MDRQLAHVVRQLVAEELVENDAQGVDVAARVNVVRIGLALLWAHVLQGPDELTDIGLQGRDRHVRVRGSSHAEVDDLGIALRVDQDVAGLQVAMNDALLVTVVDGFADPGKELETIVVTE